MGHISTPIYFSNYLKETMKLPAGTYYIGDLRFFLNEGMFDTLLPEFDYSGVAPIHVDSKIVGVNFMTLIGDGSFALMPSDVVIGVDSGTIGICQIGQGKPRLKEGWTSVTFESEFDCYNDHANIHIGDFVIDTSIDVFDPEPF